MLEQKQTNAQKLRLKLLKEDIRIAKELSKKEGVDIGHVIRLMEIEEIKELKTLLKVSSSLSLFGTMANVIGSLDEGHLFRKHRKRTDSNTPSNKDEEE